MKKDAYFFEIPKGLCRPGWQTLDEVPAFLRTPYERDGLEMPAVAEFNAAMDGIILIPQPFAELEDVFTVRSGFGITRHMILAGIVGIAVLVMFAWLARRKRRRGPPA